MFKNLNWYISKIIKKFIPHLMESWGGKTNTLIKIHKSLIQAKLNYGTTLYRTASKSLLDWLDSANNSGLRLAIGAFRSILVFNIYNIAGKPFLN